MQTLMTPGSAFRSVDGMKSERKGLRIGSRLRVGRAEFAPVTDRGMRVLIPVALVLGIAAIYAVYALAASPPEFMPVVTGSPLWPLMIGIFGG